MTNVTQYKLNQNRIIFGVLFKKGDSIFIQDFGEIGDYQRYFDQNGNKIGAEQNTYKEWLEFKNLYLIDYEK